MTPTTIPPPQFLWHMAQSVISSRALQVVAELGVADALGDTVTPAKELAHACGSDAEALDRVMRLLCAQGIFDLDGNGYRHNDLSRLLRSDDPRSMRAFARLNGFPGIWESLGALDEIVRTGEPAAPRGTDFWEYLAAHPAEAAVFELAMAQKAKGDISDLASAYDFTPFRTIADIGGGRGHLLQAALAAAPHASGVLFDLPDVIERSTAGSDRLRTQAGDFFADRLPSAELYLLMEILHDWSDPEAAAILTAVRDAAAPGATILVIEYIAPEDGLGLVCQTLDVLMLAVTGGHQRSAGQFNALLRAAGFEPSRTVRTEGPIAAVEAVAI